MRILSDINSADLTARLGVKAEKLKSFQTLSTSQTITPIPADSGKVFYVGASIEITLEHSEFVTGDFLMFIKNSAEGTANINTSDSAEPAASIDISPGQNVTAVWSGSQWVFIGNYTI